MPSSRKRQPAAPLTFFIKHCILKAAKGAKAEVAVLTTQQKNAALEEMASALLRC